MEQIETLENTPRLFTIKQAAEQIGIQYRNLLQAVHDGKVPCYKLGKSRDLVSVQEVLSVMKTEGGRNE